MAVNPINPVRSPTGVKNWHSLKSAAVLVKLKSSEAGLSNTEAQKRLKFGLNELPDQKPYSKLRLFFSQFNNPLMYVLLGTVAVSLILKHYSDTIFIVLVLLSNVVVAYYQESKAGDAINSLKKMVKINARVVRNNNQKEIDSKQLVAGDIIVLHSGNKVPADGRILESHFLKINEASLTGESLPVEKKPLVLPLKTDVQEQTNMVFMGTVVEEGFAKVIVVATGSRTQMGEIVNMLSTTEEALTPLQLQMTKLAKLTAAFISAIIVLIFIIGLYRSQSTDEILLASLALAVSAIPAGLLPAITIILVLAMRRILKQKGLVRKLVSSETLGSVTVIATDKTGTLTEGKMEVTHLITDNLELTGKKLSSFNLENPDPAAENIKKLVKISMLNNDAFLENPGDEPKNWVIRGKTTESALLRAGILMGFSKPVLEQDHLLIDKVYFSSELKFSASLRELNGDGRTGLFVVGAPEYVFSKSKVKSGKLEEHVTKLARQGLRVIACAYREFNNHPKYKKPIELINNLTTVGLIALEDPIREEAINSIKVAKKAGIKTIIVTGDHKITAQVVAQKIGLDGNDKDTVEGVEIESMSDEELIKRSKTVKIFARVSPAHKLRIIDALQTQGEVVAMVGDGVNDAPALKSADIGVAVNAGTDVAKETADLILLDDGFHSIVKAIEQGRVIFSNIRKVFVYLLADDFQELFVFLTAMIFGLPLPLLPAQILWINLVEDGLPDLALTTEQEINHVMDQPPRPKKEPVVNRPLKNWLISIFLISGTSALTLFLLGQHLTGDLDKVRTMVFALMGLDSLVFSFSVRSFRQIIFRKDIFQNRYLVAAVSISLMLLFAAVYFPPLQKLLSTQSLALKDWLIVLGFSFVEIIFIELAKITLLFKQNRPLML